MNLQKAKQYWEKYIDDSNIYFDEGYQVTMWLFKERNRLLKKTERLKIQNQKLTPPFL